MFYRIKTIQHYREITMKQTQKIGLIQNGARVYDQWVENKNDLSRLLDNGLNNLFRDVFGDPPYNEVFSVREVNQIFFDYLDSGADIMALLEGLNGKPIGFMVGMSLSSEFQNVANMPPIFFERKTGYIAEDGVDKEWRRMGLSSFMKKKMLERLQEREFEFAMLRTRSDNIPQIEAVVKSGGSMISYAQQDVARQTKLGEVKEDNRFFLFDLRPQYRQYGSYII
jgi:ribosomal protein S18 acetylase RimI-like enzyme